jgi:hypothetical protein
MNAVYSVAARLKAAERWGEEKLTGGGLKNKQFQDFPQTAILPQHYKAPDTVRTPRILKDGADSVGVLGALNRVFINIGLFSEEWLLHFKVLLGGKEITPIKIEDAEKNSSYWNATVAQTPDVALFFLKTAQPDLLKNAPGGEKYLSKDMAQLARGKKVFAETCARCHSSKIPAAPANVDEQNWAQYWQWTKTDDFKKKMTDIVMADDFLTDNYLSTERRIPATLLQTNACSPLATNALGGNIWDNFSSDAYKKLPSVGKMTLHNPIDGSTFEYELPAGGRGYTRVPSLISVWSTAPFLLNNSAGTFNPSPSIQGRMESFQDSIEKMLWPEKRDKDPILGDKVPGFIYRTDVESYIKIDPAFLPDRLSHLAGWSQRWLPWLHRWFPSVFGEEGIQIGPIPKGTPVSLLTNIDVERALENKLDLVPLLLDIKAKLRRVAGANDEEQARVFREDKDLVQKLISLSKCPDYVVNKGHYFGTSFFKGETPLGDDDKRALIEYLKTF